MSTSSREYSPDWLRNAQVPTTSILMLSSSSESVPGDSPASEDDKDDQLPISSVTKKASQVESPGKGNKGARKVAKGKTPEKPTKRQEPVWTLPSDSEYEMSEQLRPKEEDEDEESSLKILESPSKKRLKREDMGKSLTTQEKDGVLERETTTEKKTTATYVSSSRLPLVLADKVQRSKALVECEGESIDLSGDLGSVGRVVVSDSPSGNQDVLLDLKGTIYKMTILPSRTFCVVSFGQSEAKIEAIMDDFIQLKPQSNVYEAETMVEGTLEGFSFGSEDEADNRQTADDNKVDAQPQANGKVTKDKTSGAAKKKGKTVVKKPAKRKAPAAKKSKAKK